MNWRTSSKCEGGACVQVAMEGNEILVRNTNIPGEVIWFTPEEWKQFVAGVKDGEFDL